MLDTQLGLVMMAGDFKLFLVTEDQTLMLVQTEPLKRKMAQTSVGGQEWLHKGEQ